MYKRDKHGEYRVPHCWVEAFDSSGAMGHYSYFQICELREYADGSKRVDIGPALYLHDRPRASFAHRVFTNAERELRALANNESQPGSSK